MPPRVKDLQKKIAALEKQVKDAETAKQTAENQLVTAQETIEEQAAALISSAGAQGTSASADGGTEEAGDAPMDMISRPKPPKGKRVRIRRSMGVEEDVYKAIQRSIRKLVIKTALDWTLDFRHQNTDKLALLYRLARQAHPVLARYEDDWATAEIAKQYMQNARSHARDMGYIEKAGRKGRSDGENLDPPEEGGTD